MDQDVDIVVIRPLPAVFACLADPARLSSWLMPLTSCDDGALSGAQSAPLEASFVVLLGDDEAVGEVIGHEPPRYVAFRVTTPRSTHVLRITCVADETDATRVHVHQSGAEQLAIDLPALDRMLRGELAD